MADKRAPVRYDQREGSFLERVGPNAIDGDGNGGGAGSFLAERARWLSGRLAGGLRPNRRRASSRGVANRRRSTAAAYGWYRAGISIRHRGKSHPDELLGAVVRVLRG